MWKACANNQHIHFTLWSDGEGLGVNRETEKGSSSIIMKSSALIPSFLKSKRIPYCKTARNRELVAFIADFILWYTWYFIIKIRHQRQHLEHFFIYMKVNLNYLCTRLLKMNQSLCLTWFLLLITFSSWFIARVQVNLSLTPSECQRQRQSWWPSWTWAPPVGVQRRRLPVRCAPCRAAGPSGYLPLLCCQMAGKDL